MVCSNCFLKAPLLWSPVLGKKHPYGQDIFQPECLKHNLCPLSFVLLVTDWLASHLHRTTSYSDGKEDVGKGISLCVSLSVCAQEKGFNRVLLRTLGSYQKKPALTASPTRQSESCPDCRNKICSNIEQERIQQAVLSRLFVVGPDSMAGPLESCPVCLYLGRNFQNQVQLLSKISKLPAAGRVLMLLGPRTGGSANGITPNISSHWWIQLIGF